MFVVYMCWLNVIFKQSKLIKTFPYRTTSYQKLYKGAVVLYHCTVMCWLLFFLLSLAAQIFSMNPFEPWTTPDKVERVRNQEFARTLLCTCNCWPSHQKANSNSTLHFYFLVSYNRPEVSRTSWSGGSWDHSFHCRTKGYRDSASPPQIPFSGGWPGWDEASQDCQLLNDLARTSQHQPEDSTSYCSSTIFCT